jgi:hypothetical protein
MSGKKANEQGPAGQVLVEGWNSLHDIEYGLKQASQPYNVAASYDGPAGKDAKSMVKLIAQVVSSLEKISSGGGAEFNKLIKAEQSFIKKHGTPGDYAEEQRARIYPRSASDMKTADDVLND